MHVGDTSWRHRMALAAAAVAIVAGGCGPAAGPDALGSSATPAATDETTAPGLPRPPDAAFAATVTSPCPEGVAVESALAGTIAAIDDTGPVPWVTVHVDRWFTDDLGLTFGLWAPGWEGQVGQDWLLAATRYQSGTVPSGDIIPCHSQPRTSDALEGWEQRWDGSVSAGADVPERPADPQVLVRLDEARARWEATAPPSWTASIALVDGDARGSDCGDGVIRVVVDGGTVVEAIDLASDCPVPPGDAPTIEDVFDRARQVAGALQGDVEFDDTHGFIRSMDAHDRAVDVSLGVTDFLPRAIPLADDAPASLADARARWNEAGVDDYRMVTEVQCFCPSAGPVTVEVRDGQPTTISPTGDTATLGPDLTVAAVFDAIGAAQAEGDVDVAYDPDLGYPVQADLDPVLNAVDDEVSYRILELTPIR